MEDTEIEALKSVIDYLWHDEAKDYFCERPEKERVGHVFEDVLRLKAMLKQCDKQALYVDSPFDLASEEDNAYRDLIDNILD